ncbi:unnamed protein product [Zymoseptoria tritici ST99CH_1A5]|uniref:Uncharacterized protein n=2 Tax=Zymoseptoria tritici TaxID=1047171 RepID=A0A1X7S9S9_ZYMT9|nr:unnamed protein product [Zymoseptoria tritici ST99CH_3D7]SMY30227.1 unnamed protein product [Zymoseptoria tritici ST99CH_1A5]
MPPAPPTFGLTLLTPTQLLSRNAANARSHPLKPHPHSLTILTTWCSKYALDRYHMPDATNLLHLLEKMNYIQGLQNEEEVCEVAFRVGSILIKKFLGVKREGDGRAATAKEVGVLSGEVGGLWMEMRGEKRGEDGVGEGGDCGDGAEVGGDGGDEKKIEEVDNEVGEVEHGQEEIEEDGHGGIAAQDDSGEQDDEDSLARLENAYATRVQQPHKSTAQQFHSEGHLRKATLAAATAVDEPKTPAPTITAKVKTQSMSTPGQIKPAPAHLLKVKATNKPAQKDDVLETKLNQAKLYMAEVNKTKLDELYKQREALIKSIAARKAEEETLENKLRVKREEMVLLMMSIDA